MNNIPKIKLGIVAVSRDCFPESLSVNRRKALVEAYRARYDAEDIYEFISNACAGDVVLFLGAGDIYFIAKKLLSHD